MLPLWKKSFYQPECVCESHAVVSDSLWTVACKIPLSMEFSRQEYWSGLPFPYPMIKTSTVLKSRDITLPTRVHIVKTMVFPVVTYGWESWTIKKAERRRTDAFELWCWRRLLQFHWTARRSKQSILKEINLEYSLEGLMMLMLKHPILWSPDSRSQCIGKDPDAGKDWGQEKGVTDGIFFPKNTQGWVRIHLNLIVSVNTLWQIRSQWQVPGVGLRASTRLWGRG